MYCAAKVYAPTIITIAYTDTHILGTVCMIVIMKLTGLHLCLECHFPVMIKEGTVDGNS